MKMRLSFLAVVFFGMSMALAQSDQFFEPLRAPSLDADPVVSPDGALEMTVIEAPSGQPAAVVVVERAFGETFVFPVDSGIGNSRKGNRSAAPHNESDGGGSDSGGSVPSDASLELMGCSGSVCSYGVYVGGEYAGTLVVDYSGPQPKATLIPPQSP
jgi:hypothetical protein